MILLQETFHSLVPSLVTNNGNTARFIAFYKTNSSLGLSVSNSYASFLTVANNDSSFISPDYEFPSSKSNCTILINGMSFPLHGLIIIVIVGLMVKR